MHREGSRRFCTGEGPQRSSRMWLDEKTEWADREPAGVKAGEGVLGTRSAFKRQHSPQRPDSDISDREESAYNAGDPGSIPGSGRSPGEGNGYPLQYSCLKNPMDSLWGHTELDTTEWLTLSLPPKRLQLYSLLTSLVSRYTYAFL